MRNPARDIPHYLGVFQQYLGRRLYLVFALTLSAALAEGLGILMLLPLLESLDVTSGQRRAIGESPGVSGMLRDVLASFGLADSVVAVLLIITTAFLLKGALTFGASGFNAYLCGQLLRELKGRLFGHYSRMSYSYYARKDAGHFINILNQQTTQMLQAFQHITLLGSEAVKSFIYLMLAFIVAWRFGLMALLLGVALLFLFRWLNEYVRGLSRKTSSESGNLAQLLIESLHAFKYLVSTGQMPQLQRSVTGSIQRLTGYEMRRGLAAAFTQAVREPVAVVLIMLIVLVQLVVLEQPLTPILISIVLLHRGINSIMAIQGAWQRTLDQIGSVELVHDEFAAQRANQEPDGMRPVPALSQSIQLHHVSFSYETNLGPVLEDISLEVPVRTSVALVGESGAGKSTLVDLVTLMLKPTCGQVLIDGVPGEEIQLSSWRSQIGYVSQETVVFDDTIANNICLWDGDIEWDEGLLGRIREAARQAHIAHFIESLPDGYRTLVGDRGLRLSGGQRQRLFIARELFRRPNLLILDEATSALDTDSERSIQESIDNLRGRVTLIIIAHRLSTIRNVDHVYVFEAGRLVEDGPYAALRDDEGSRFGKLAAKQAL